MGNLMIVIDIISLATDVEFKRLPKRTLRIGLGPVGSGCSGSDDAGGPSAAFTPPLLCTYSSRVPRCSVFPLLCTNSRRSKLVSLDLPRLLELRYATAHRS